MMGARCQLRLSRHSTVHASYCSVSRVPLDARLDASEMLPRTCGQPFGEPLASDSSDLGDRANAAFIEHRY